MKTIKLLPLLFLVLSASLSAAPTELSEHAKAFADRGLIPWENPVLSMDEDPREIPDIDKLLDRDDLSVFASDYFPGWVIRTWRDQLHLFQRLPQVWRVGGPTRAAFMTDKGVRIVGEGESLAAKDFEGMSRPWILVWFAGSRNWERFDMPVLLVLQHRPKGMLFQNGISLYFDKNAGDTVMMNLYGYYRPPQNNPDSLRFADAVGKNTTGPFDIEFGPVAPKNIRPFEWVDNLPEGVIRRCNYFSRLSRAVPRDVIDSFQVDLARERLRLRYQYLFHEIKDDWKTAPIYAAPVSPMLSLATKYGLPIQFNAQIFDPVYPTTLGPWTLALGKKEYTADIYLLQYLTQTRKVKFNLESEDEFVKKSVENMVEKAQEFATTRKPYGPDKIFPKKDIKGQNFCWGVLTNDRTRAIGSHYLQGEELELSRENQRNFMMYSVFTRSGYKEFETEWDKTVLYRHDAGIHGDIYGDAGKLVVDSFLTGWLYSYHARDYDWINERIDVMERLCSNLQSMDWTRIGRPNIAEMGDEAAPMMGYTRMMYAARDQRKFAWGVYSSVGELLKIFVKCGPMGAYARDFQPWSRYEFMSPTENATDINGFSAGWDIGGPGEEKIFENMKGGVDVMPYKRHGTGQWSARWRCMADFDVNRFMTDHCVEGEGGLRYEFDTWLERDFSHIKAGTEVPATSNRFVNPAFLSILRMNYLGESLDLVWKKLGGWKPTWNHFTKQNWNWEPFPFLFMAVEPNVETEQLMSGEVFPWTPGLESEYPVYKNDLVYHRGMLGKKNDLTGEIYPPFPHVDRWSQPARPKHSAFGLGFVTVFPGFKIATANYNHSVYSARYSTETVEPDPQEVALEKLWKFSIDPEAKGIEEGWMKPDFDDSKWTKINVPGLWEEQGFGNKDGVQPKGKIPPEIKVNQPPNHGWSYDGAAWYRTSLIVPESFRGKTIQFHAGTIDDFDIVYINGVQVGKTDTSTTKTWWKDTRLYTVPESVLNFGGKNIIAVLVGDNNSGGGINSGPVRLIAK